MYLDVILPLPLNTTFTYILPPGMGNVSKGVRVLVPFGKSKTYVGLVVGVYEEKKTDYKLKNIIEIIDKEPIVQDSQLRLWNWIADYYMSSVGDVMKAALPSGMKIEDGYKPKTELCVGLPEQYRKEETLHDVMNSLSRARKQLNVFTTFLALSFWDRLEGDNIPNDIQTITRDELVNSSQTSTSVVKALVDRGFLYLYEREVGRLNNAGEAHFERMNELNPYQTQAMKEIKDSFEKHDVCLLNGVTSSGKTEIYIHLIEEQIRQGKQVLYLLPEIALTVQIMQRLQRIFGNRLGIYHSKYSDAERVEIWQKQLSDKPYDVILGARSAVFPPLQRLGLVIVDEEHEMSYKQQDPAPRYHARSVAIMLAKMLGAKTLLGTATPSMESYYNAHSGKYGLVMLTHRYKDIKLPEILVVDTKDLYHRKMMRGPFSPLLIESIKNALDNKEQIILFQNRRGFAPIMECSSCGWTPKCDSCDVSLTYHKSEDILTCHYCGRKYKITNECPKCGSHTFKSKGFGTEKIEEEISILFPSARIARMDLDTTRTRSAYERILNDFSKGRINILIGTQIISKGLDFDKVSIVGILDADSIMNYPDFRAYEHAYMMMTQVSGRAGRKDKQGKVILQTKNPELPLVKYIVENDFPAFSEEILVERGLFHYPPFYRVIYIYVKNKNLAATERCSLFIVQELRKVLGDRVLGPDKPAISMAQSLHIRKIVLKLERTVSLPQVRRILLSVQEKALQTFSTGGIQVYFDVDPL